MKTLHCDKNIPDIQKTHPRCRGPSKKAFEKKADGQRKLGWGPQQKGFRKESRRTTQAGVGPQQKEMQNAFLRITQGGVDPTK